MPIHDWTRVPAGIFHDFHSRWIARLAETISGLLPPEYYVLAEQKAGEIGPDVLTLQGGDNGNGSPAVGDAPASQSVCTLTATLPKVRFRVRTESDEYARKARQLVIRHVSGDRIIGVVEIVSPGNKASQHAIRDFVENAVGAIRQGISLLIVDLFPPTPRDPQGIHWAIWQEIDASQVYTPPPDKPLTLVAYVRDPDRAAFIEPAAVGDKLIDMPLFLDPARYLDVPLEATYQATWQWVPRRFRDALEVT